MPLLQANLENLEKLPIGRILAVDYGDKRVGLALSDPMQILASPIDTVVNEGKKKLFRKLVGQVMERECCCVVLGMPYHLHGDVGEKAQHVEQFATELARRVSVPIFLWDERWTTVSAHKTLLVLGESPSKNRGRVDRMAAAYILQAFLDRLASLRNSRV